MLSALSHEYTDVFVCASVLVVTTLCVHAEYKLVEYIYVYMSILHIICADLDDS